MKILIRTDNPYIHAVTGAPHPKGRGFERSVLFESLVKEALSELGHELVEQPFNPLVPDLEVDVDFRIYPHLTKREKPAGDLFQKEMHLPGLFTLDREGWGVDHSAMRSRPPFDEVDPERAERFCRALCAHFMITGQSRAVQPEPGPVGVAGEFILVPLQVPSDSVIERHSPVSVLEFLEAVTSWADREARQLVVKPHPTRRSDAEVCRRLEERAAVSPHVVRGSGNIHSLIAASCGVWVINSGTGFESLVHGRPVVTFGRADYGWVTGHGDLDDLAAAWDHLEASGPGRRRTGYQFVYDYFWRHAFSISNEALADTRRRLPQFLEHELARKGVALGASSGRSAPPR